MTDKPRGIGGPGAAVVAGLSPYKTPLQYFYELRGELPEATSETEAMEWGLILEEPIAKKYADLTGRKIRRQPPKLSNVHPFMRASIDYQVVSDPRGPGILECKNFGYWTGKSIKSFTDIPDHVYVQGQHYLAVYGYQWCSFALLIGGQHFVWFDVERHEAVITKLIDIETKFWEKVQRNEPPPIDGSTQTAEILKQLYPQDSGTVVTINDAEFLSHALGYLEWKTKEKEAEAAKIAEENFLKARLQDTMLAKVPGFGEFSWKTAAPARKEVLDLERFRAEQPDLYQKYLRVEMKASGRRFLVHPYALVPQENPP